MVAVTARRQRARVDTMPWKATCDAVDAARAAMGARNAGRQMPATVLIVEDEFNIGKLVRTYLERDGDDVVWVRSGEDGLVELGRHAIDLIVLDIGLPGIDGFEV